LGSGERNKALSLTQSLLRGQPDFSYFFVAVIPARSMGGIIRPSDDRINWFRWLVPCSAQLGDERYETRGIKSNL